MAKKGFVFYLVLAIFFSSILLPVTALSIANVELPEDDIVPSNYSVNLNQDNLSLRFEENWNFDNVRLKSYDPEEFELEKTDKNLWNLVLDNKTKRRYSKGNLHFTPIYILNYSISPEYRFMVRKDASPNGFEILNTSRENPELLVDLEEKRDKSVITWVLELIGLKEEPKEINIELVWGGADGDNPFLEREKESGEGLSYTLTHKLSVDGQNLKCPKSSKDDILYKCTVPSNELEDRFSVRVSLSVNASTSGSPDSVMFR